MKIANLREKSLRVLTYYKNHTDVFTNFQKKSGLHCLAECGACCLHPEVSATFSEMLPAAFSLFDQGLAEEKFSKLNITDKPTCIFYKATSTDQKKGYCSNYDFRPSVCRTFGACAVKDKTGKKKLNICQEIKKSTTLNLQNICLDDAPNIHSFSTNLHLEENDHKLLPINEALKLALEEILFMSSYEEKLGENTCQNSI